MKVLKETFGESVVLTLKGEFDSFVTSAFGDEIGKVQEDGSHRIVLNMRLVKFVNSTALGAMIKARKSSRSLKGDLVVSQPSKAVREAMESLGLDRLFSIYDDDESALTALDASGSVQLDQSAESTVIIHVPGEDRPTVARLSRLDAGAIECRISGTGHSHLVEGRKARVKFRLPLYRKEYFELTGRIESVNESSGSTETAFRLLEVSPEDQGDIERFMADMADLRQAARETE